MPAQVDVLWTIPLRSKWVEYTSPTVVEVKSGLVVAVYKPRGSTYAAFAKALQYARQAVAAHNAPIRERYKNRRRYTYVQSTPQATTV